MRGSNYHLMGASSPGPVVTSLLSLGTGCQLEHMLMFWKLGVLAPARPC